MATLTASVSPTVSGTCRVLADASELDAFVPSDASGLILWLSAGPAWCFTDSGATTPAGNGDLVYTWSARIGSWTVQQATSGDRPTLRSTSGVYDVRGVSADYLNLTGSGFNGLSGFTLFIAGIADSTPAVNKTLIALGDPSNQSLGIIRSDGTNWAFAGMEVGGSAVSMSTTTVVTTGSRFVIGVRFDPTLSSQRQKMYSSSTVIGSANISGSLPATLASNLRLLTDSFDSSRGWPGGIYEMVAYDNAISDANLVLLAAYLSG